ncbi:hypothetical protein VMCG_04610 [Cytospora schulzeri]|uniref:F-box domain-containing protein n=1 Tax=Cytospora schulzeri TaxID=448051 RepID=A0A423WRE0_9PEZI|nr:hypothetical protein VMCG_04610 [Valsa malicola]
MPSPMVMAIEGSTRPKQKGNRNAKTSNNGATELRSNPKHIRPGNAALLPTSTLPVGHSRKRLADDHPWIDANKRHMSSDPRVSPNTEKGFEKHQTPIRSSLRAFDDLQNHSDQSSLLKSPGAGSAHYTFGSPSTNTKTPFLHKCLAPRTDPVRKKPAFIDLTGEDGPSSPLAHRSKKPELIDLTGDNDPVGLPALRASFRTTSLRDISYNNGRPNPIGGGVAINLPRRVEVSQETVGSRLTTRDQGLKTPNSSNEKELTAPVSHERSTSVYRCDNDPATPQRGDIGDGNIATEDNNTNESLESTSHHGEASNTVIPTAAVETDSGPEPGGDNTFADDGPSLDQDEVSETSSVEDNNEDDSDEEYVPVPCTPSRRPRNKRPSRQRPSAPPAKRTRVVILKTPSEKARQFLVRLKQDRELPIGNSCFFFLLPLEVRQLIYRHLLCARGPIQVLNGWSRLFRLQRREKLHPRILGASRPIFDEAVRVLYAENVFRYVVRDTRAERMAHVPDAPTINVETYARYFRRLELRVERNRTGPLYGVALARALDILKINGANLYKLTIDVSPRIEEDDTVSMTRWFDQGGPVNTGLKALSTSFIQIHLTTPSTDTDTSKSLRCVIDKRCEVSELEFIRLGGYRQPEGSDPLTEEDRRKREADLRELIRDKQISKAHTQLDQLSSQIGNACRNPGLASQQGWFEQFEVTWGRPDYSGSEEGS